MPDATILPVLPLQQPYCSWCFARPHPGAPPVKQVETRARPWSHVGWVGLHAMAAPVDGAVSVRGGRAIAQAYGRPMTLAYPKASVIGLVYLSRCTEMTAELIAAQTPLELAMGIWTPGRYALTFAHQTLLPTPVPYKAFQGINHWTPPATVLEMLQRLERQRQTTD